MLGKNKPERILFLSDSPDFITGYSHQLNRLIRGLKGNYEIGVIGGNAAPIHGPLYEKPLLSRKYQYNNVIIYPVKGYGNKHEIKAIFEDFDPDVFILIPDFRFFEEQVLYDDILYRKNCIMITWHIWDNEPPPTFNIPKYLSFDGIFAVSPLTLKITKKAFDLLNHDILFEQKDYPVIDYIPETIDTNQYKPLRKFNEKLKTYEAELKKRIGESDFVILGVGVAVRRKMFPILICAVDKFAKLNPDKKITLLLHTSKSTQQLDLRPLLNPSSKLLRGFTNEYSEKNKVHYAKIVVSYIEDKYSDDFINILYNFADVTINVSNAEGFGLPIIESMSAETPVIAPDTGGVREFIRHKNDISTGILLPIKARELLSSPVVPFIYSDYVSENDIIKALKMMMILKDDFPNIWKEMKTFCRQVAEEYDYRALGPIFEEKMLKLYKERNKRKYYNVINLTKIAEKKELNAND